MMTGESLSNNDSSGNGALEQIIFEFRRNSLPRAKNYHPPAITPHTATTSPT